MSRPDDPGEGRLKLESSRWTLTWEPAGAGVSARLFGRRVSSDDPNRAEGEFDPARGAARARQVHGADCLVVDRAGDAGSADALVTTATGLPLLIRVADCVPLFLVAPGGIALAHAGWRGTVAGIAGRAAAGLIAASGTHPAEISAWIGPAIGACCYEVGDEVASRFDPRHTRLIDGRTHVDLAAANRDALRAAGIPEERIALSGRCTRCEQHLFHSHRGSGGKPGRLEAWIMRHSPQDSIVRR